MVFQPFEAMRNSPDTSVTCQVLFLLSCRGFGPRILIFVVKGLGNLCVLLAVDFDVGIDEVIQRITGLLGLEDDVPPERELDPVLVVGAEKVGPLLGMLARF